MESILMRRSHAVGTSRSRGTTLIVCLILSVIVMGFVAGGITIARATSSWFSHTIDQTEVLALAESATEIRQKTLIEEIANFETDDVLLGDRTHRILAGDRTLEVTSIVIRDATDAGDFEIQVTDADGVMLFISYYRITGTARVGDVEQSVTRSIQVGRCPLFQYCVFYDGDLEILPGPSMTLGGRVHANGDIYLNCGRTLTIDSQYLRCTGEIFRGRKNTSAAPSGTVSVRRYCDEDYADLAPAMASATRWDGGACDPVYYGNYGGDPNTWVDYANARWGSTIQTQAHGVKEVAAPQIHTLDPGGHYHREAGLVVEYSGDGLKVMRRLDNGAVQDMTFSLPDGAVSLSSMYDGREGRDVSLVDVDLGKLRDAGLCPGNGLIYAYRTDTDESNPNGIRFTNGKELGNPTFLVSPDPVYLQGDFNAPASDSAYTKQPALVMSDALNLLSNSWDNTKRAGSGLPVAAPTAVNAAMISGIVPTLDIPDGSYSGGLENYPRFHEKWSGVELKIRGSFISLFESRYARGKWRYGSPVYTAPGRNWGFDPDLLKHGSSFLSSIIPFAVYVRRLAWDDNNSSLLD